MLFGGIVVKCQAVTRVVLFCFAGECKVQQVEVVYLLLKNNRFCDNGAIYIHENLHWKQDQYHFLHKLRNSLVPRILLQETDQSKCRRWEK